MSKVQEHIEDALVVLSDWVQGVPELVESIGPEAIIRGYEPLENLYKKLSDLEVYLPDLEGNRDQVCAIFLDSAPFIRTVEEILADYKRPVAFAMTPDGGLAPWSVALTERVQFIASLD